MRYAWISNIELILLRDSVFEVSKENDLSFTELRGLRHDMNRVLPDVIKSISALDEHLNIGLDRLGDGQDNVTNSIKLYAEELQCYRARIEYLKDYLVEDFGRERIRSMWQQDLEKANCSMQKSITAHLELLMRDFHGELQDIIKEKISDNQVTTSNRDQLAITTILNLVGSAAGVMLALST